MSRSVCLHQSKGILLQDRIVTNRRLRSRIPDLIDQRQLPGQRWRVSRAGGSMLGLPSHVQREGPPLRGRRSSGDIVEAGLIRPPIVVADRLSKVVAIEEGRPFDPQKPRITGL